MKIKNKVEKENPDLYPDGWKEMDMMFMGADAQKRMKKNTKDLKNAEVKEMDASCSGSYEAPVGMPIIKRKMPNTEVTEQMDASVSAGSAYDVPFGGGGTRGRKNPLKIDGKESIGKRRKTIRKKKIPLLGGPGAKFVVIKDRCKKFPYCNQGPEAIKLINESMDLISEAILDISKKYGIPINDVKKIVLNEIKHIFIK